MFGRLITRIIIPQMVVWQLSHKSDTNIFNFEGKKKGCKNKRSLLLKSCHFSALYFAIYRRYEIKTDKKIRETKELF